MRWREAFSALRSRARTRAGFATGQNRKWARRRSTGSPTPSTRSWPSWENRKAQLLVQRQPALRDGIAISERRVGEPDVALDRAGVTVFRDITLLAAGPASGSRYVAVETVSRGFTTNDHRES